MSENWFREYCCNCADGEVALARAEVIRGVIEKWKAMPAEAFGEWLRAEWLAEKAKAEARDAGGS